MIKDLSDNHLFNNYPCESEDVKIESLRQQLTAALDEARMAKVSADEVRSTYAEEMRKLSQQLASRDAEVAKWKDAYLKVVERIHMVGGYQDQSKERDQLNERLDILIESSEMLAAELDELRLDSKRYGYLTRECRARDFIIPASERKQSIDSAIDKALAATEPK